jgi:hypothetical protein
MTPQARKQLGIAVLVVAVIAIAVASYRAYRRKHGSDHFSADVSPCAEGGFSAAANAWICPAVAGGGCMRGCGPFAGAPGQAMCACPVS